MPRPSAAVVPRAQRSKPTKNGLVERIARDPRGGSPAVGAE